MAGVSERRVESNRGSQPTILARPPRMYSPLLKIGFVKNQEKSGIGRREVSPNSDYSVKQRDSFRSADRVPRSSWHSNRSNDYDWEKINQTEIQKFEVYKDHYVVKIKKDDDDVSRHRVHNGEGETLLRKDNRADQSGKGITGLVTGDKKNQGVERDLQKSENDTKGGKPGERQTVLKISKRLGVFPLPLDKTQVNQTNSNPEKSSSKIIGHHSNGREVLLVRKDGAQVISYDAQGREILGFTQTQRPVYNITRSGLFCTSIDSNGDFIYGQDIWGRPLNQQAMDTIDNTIASTPPVCRDSNGVLYYGFSRSQHPIISFTESGRDVLGFDSHGNRVLGLDKNGPVYGVTAEGVEIYGYDIKGNLVTRATFESTGVQYKDLELFNPVDRSLTADDRNGVLRYPNLKPLDHTLYHIESLTQNTKTTLPPSYELFDKDLRAFKNPSEVVYINDVIDEHSEYGSINGPGCIGDDIFNSKEDHFRGINHINHDRINDQTVEMTDFEKDFPNIGGKDHFESDKQVERGQNNKDMGDITLEINDQKNGLNDKVDIRQNSSKDEPTLVCEKRDLSREKGPLVDHHEVEEKSIRDKNEAHVIENDNQDGSARSRRIGEYKIDEYNNIK